MSSQILAKLIITAQMITISDAQSKHKLSIQQLVIQVLKALMGHALDTLLDTCKFHCLWTCNNLSIM